MSEIELVHPDLGFGLLEAKQSFERLFLFYVDRETYIFRPLTVSECESIYSLANYIDGYVVDEWVLTKTILTKNLDVLLYTARAGVANSLATAIIKSSALTSPEEIASLLDKEREDKTTIANIIDNMVKLGAGYMVKDTKSLTYRQQIKYVAFSEDIVGKKLELSKPVTLPKGKTNKKLSRETAAILSKEAADIPDFTKDNAALRGV